MMRLVLLVMAGALIGACKHRSPHDGALKSQEAMSPLTESWDSDADAAIQEIYKEMEMPKRADFAANLGCVSVLKETVWSQEQKEQAVWALRYLLRKKSEVNGILERQKKFAQSQAQECNRLARVHSKGAVFGFLHSNRPAKADLQKWRETAATLQKDARQCVAAQARILEVLDNSIGN